MNEIICDWNSDSACYNTGCKLVPHCGGFDHPERILATVEALPSMCGITRQEHHKCAHADVTKHRVACYRQLLSRQSVEAMGICYDIRAYPQVDSLHPLREDLPREDLERYVSQVAQQVRTSFRPV
jgi:hypothetical protein